MTPHETYTAHFPLIAAAPDAWTALHAQDAVFVSEQLARRLGLTIGKTLDIPTSGRDWPARIVGVFPDYGNRRAAASITRSWRYFDDASGVHYSSRRSGATARHRKYAATLTEIARSRSSRSQALSTDIFELHCRHDGAEHATRSCPASRSPVADQRHAARPHRASLGVGTRRKLAALEMARP
jgi:putative ABC transport system permease protein